MFFLILFCSTFFFNSSSTISILLYSTILRYSGSIGLDNTLRELCKEAGIPEKSFHDIRRTVASKLFANGRTLEEIRKFLGHKDITTTQGYIYSLDKDSEYGKAMHDSLQSNKIEI